MSHSKVDLKNPWIAATLAYLIPGAGHLYQRRFFKGVLYFVCILGTFFYGMYLGNWKIVYFRWEPGHKTIGYLSQVLVGLPALPSLIQWKRYVPPAADHFGADRRNEKLAVIDKPLSSTFNGRMSVGDDGAIETVSGHITLDPVPGEFGWDVKGTFTGLRNDQTKIELTIDELIEIGPKLFASEEITYTRLVANDANRHRVFASNRRYLQCRVAQHDGEESRARYIEGTIPRKFRDWYQVPMENGAREDLHEHLGKLVELARVFTWIAGLLNLLAIWDALEGPAYGYGDEEEKRDDEAADPSNEKPKSETTSASEISAGSSANPKAEASVAMQSPEASVTPNPKS